MAINDEMLMTLSEAAKSLPRINGRKIAVSTLWRWARRGLRGVHLEYLRIGRTITTSSEALHRFFTALAEIDAMQSQSSGYKSARLKNRHSSDKARQRAIEEANAILVRAGITQPAAHQDD